MGDIKKAYILHPDLKYGMEQKISKNQMTFEDRQFHIGRRAVAQQNNKTTKYVH